MERLVERRVTPLVEESLRYFRVVVLHGARQVGKSTLALELARGLGARVVSMDAAPQLAAASADPPGFLEVMGTPAVIDEIQRVGQPLVLAVKAAVDADTRPGRYVLTGSTNFLTVPTISESLAGRVDLVALWPFSQGELHGGSDGFVDRAFEGPAQLLGHDGPVLDRQEYLERVCAGGYPDAARLPERPRIRWFEQYVATVTAREVAVADDIRRLDSLVGLLRYAAATTSGELVVATTAQRLGIHRETVASYLAWLETVFLVHRVPAWGRNLTAKVIKRPRLHVADTGLAAALMGRQPAMLRNPTEPATGPLVETFVVNELAKQLTWSQVSARLNHFRDRDGVEVDAILESTDGRVVGIEVKASTTPRSEDFAGLAKVRDALDRSGGNFLAGVVLHTGDARLPFGDRLVALPIADLWT
ncbi:MAG: ATP-binding protein [Sporichthyaceae bacterium]